MGSVSDVRTFASRDLLRWFGGVTLAVVETAMAGEDLGPVDPEQRDQGRRGGHVDRVADQPSGEERRYQRHQRRVDEPGRDEQLGRGQRREGEQTQPG